MKLILASVAVLWWVCAEAPEAATATLPAAGAGPENQGLRLKLSITTTRPGGSDTHAIRLDLFNVGQQPKTLVAHFAYEEAGSGYAEYFKSAVSFTTYPDVQPSGAQTAGAMRKSPQPTRELKPGDCLTVTWTALGPSLKPDNILDAPNTSPVFPGPGLYGVRAEFTATTTDEKRILLTSNEEPVMVGGSAQMPKYATAEVTSADPTNKAARINLGSDHGIAVGDVFLVRWGLGAAWHLTVKKVDPQGAEGTVSTLHHSLPQAPGFPDNHWLATLVPPRPTPEELVREIGAQALVKDAWQTQARYVKAGRTLAGDIPASHWGEAIRRLKPQRVYLHRVNVVAVLKTDADREEGLYIYIPISSYLPRNGEDGFTFAEVDRDIQKFSRSTKIPIKP